VALPLHVFEERYKAMVERCLADRSPFGVVLIREGREVGPGDLAVAGVGTVAQIREATRYRDGRFDLLTLGTQRFRREGVAPAAAGGDDPVEPGAVSSDLSPAPDARLEQPEPEHTFDAALNEAARRLTIPEDPTVLSYVLSGIVQIESIRRQGLLEMPTTELR